MKTYQQKANYNPVKIELKERREAVAFFSIIDKLDSFMTHANSEIKVKDLTLDERALIVDLSNAKTSGDIVF